MLGRVFSGENGGATAITAEHARKIIFFIFLRTFPVLNFNLTFFYSLLWSSFYDPRCAGPKTTEKDE
jgi:hypothetical protein